MPSFEIEFEVKCSSCGSELIAETKVKRNSLSMEDRFVVVEPCKTCIDEAKDEVHSLVADRDEEIKRLEKEVESLSS